MHRVTLDNKTYVEDLLPLNFLGCFILSLVGVREDVHVSSVCLHCEGYRVDEREVMPRITGVGLGVGSGRRSSVAPCQFGSPSSFQSSLPFFLQHLTGRGEVWGVSCSYNHNSHNFSFPFTSRRSFESLFCRLHSALPKQTGIAPALRQCECDETFCLLGRSTGRARPRRA